MQLRYNFRLYPTQGQQEALARVFGCVRVVYNDALDAMEAAQRFGRPDPTDGELSKALTLSKATAERSWLAGSPAVPLQNSVADACTARRNHEASKAGRRTGPKVEPPRRKTRRDRRQSARFTRNARFTVTAGRRLKLPKIGELKVAWSRELPSDPSSVTVLKDSAGRYFASFVVDAGDEPLPAVEAEVGIDLGLAAFAVLSDGTVIESPRFLRQAERQLRKAHKALSRKQKGSKNREKARLRLAKAHAAVADRRRDFLHKASTTVIRENQAVYVEDLFVRGLARTRLAKSVHDAGWGMFTRMLAYKAQKYGRNVGKVGRFYPSSQICSGCGAKDGPKPLAVRQWQCAACGAVHDRDLNAARNILAAGQAERLNACGGGVRPGPAPAVA